MRILLPLTIAAGVLAAGCNPQQRGERRAAAATEHFNQDDFAAAEIEAKNALAGQPDHPQALKTLGIIRVRQGALLEGGKLLWEANRLLPADTEVELHLARAMLGAGFAADSRKQLLSLLDRVPDHGAALMMLAEAAAGPDDLRECDARIARATPADTTEVLLARAMVSLRRDDLDSAQQQVEHAIQQDPNSAQALALLGNIERVRRHPEAALPLLRRAAALAARRSPEPLALAAMLSESGQPGEAASLLAGLTDATPDYLPAWRMRGAVAAAMGRPSEAQQYLARVLAKAPADIEATLLQAQLLAGQGRSQQSLSLLESLRATYPYRTDIVLATAQAQRAAGDLRKAAALLDELLASHPQHPAAASLRATILLEQGQPAEAVRLAEKLITAAPGNRAAEDLLIAALEQAGEPQRALERVNARLAQSPQDPDLIVNQGRLLIATGETAAAREAFTNALRHNPDHPGAASELVKLDAAAGQLATARELASGLLARHPQSADAHLIMASLHRLTGDFAAAETEVATALNLQPDKLEAWSLRAAILIDSQRCDEAVVALRELVASAPDHLPGWMQLASLLTTLGRTEEARQTYADLIHRRPGYAPAYNNLAMLGATTPAGLTTAANHARKARALDPASPEIAHTLGNIEWQLGNRREALSLLGEAAAALPTSASAQLDLGRAHYMMNQSEEAAAALTKALALQPDAAVQATAQRMLSHLRATGPFDLATLAGQLEQTPDDIVILLRIANCQANAGQHEAAMASYQRALTYNSDLVDAYLGQAHILTKTQQPEKALEAATQARRLAPTSPRAMAALGRANRLAGKHLLAYHQLAEAASQLANDPLIHAELAEAAYAVGELAVAREHFAMLAATSGEPASKASEFLKLTAPGAHTDREALALAEARLAADPCDVPALMLRAASSPPELAIPIHRKILSLLPEFTPAQLALADILVNTQDSLAQAETLARQARQRHPDNPQACSILAMASFKRGNLPEAKRLLTELATIRPLLPAELAALNTARGSN